MRRTLLVVVCLLTAAALSLPGFANAAGADSVLTGIVSGQDGPIASAGVKVEYLAKGGLPRRTALLTTTADGSWSYSGKAGDYRLTFSAEGYAERVEVTHVEPKATKLVNVLLSPVPPPTGAITGRITSAAGYGLSGYAYFFKQNPDGSWPTGYQWQVPTASDGSYSSGPLPLGVYKVRMFTVHTGVQWYRYATTMDAATPVSLATAGDVVSGVDAVYPPPGWLGEAAVNPRY